MSCIQNTANADFAIFYKHVTSEKEAEFLPLSDCLPKFFASLIICLSPLQGAPNNALLDSALRGAVLHALANVLYPKYCKCGFRYFLQTCDVRKGGRIPSTFRLLAEIFCLSHNMPISFTRSPKQRIVGFCAKGRGSACASKCPVSKIL